MKLLHKNVSEDSYILCVGDIFTVRHCEKYFNIYKGDKEVHVFETPMFHIERLVFIDDYTLVYINRGVRGTDPCTIHVFCMHAFQQIAMYKTSLDYIYDYLSISFNTFTCIGLYLDEHGRACFGMYRVCDGVQTNVLTCRDFHVICHQCKNL